MIRATGIFVAVLFLVLPAYDVDAGTIKEDVVSPYVGVTLKEDGSGASSGVVINLRGKKYILTAAHVVEDAMVPTIKTFLDSSRRQFIADFAEWKPAYIYKEFGSTKKLVMKCKIVWYEAPQTKGGNDLALLEPLEDLDIPAAKMKSSVVPEVGEDCWYIGSPGGLHASLERSIINRDDYIQSGLHYYVVNGHGYYGNSGGPLFIKRDNDYYLIGLIVMFENTRNARSSLLSPKLEAISDFLDLYIKSLEQKP